MSHWVKSVLWLLKPQNWCKSFSYTRHQGRILLFFFVLSLLFLYGIFSLFWKKKWLLRLSYCLSIYLSAFILLGSLRHQHSVCVSLYPPNFCFYVIRAVSKEIRRSVLPTSYFLISCCTYILKFPFLLFHFPLLVSSLWSSFSTFSTLYILLPSITFCSSFFSFIFFFFSFFFLFLPFLFFPFPLFLFLYFHIILVLTILPWKSRR
jgi:hypothetical protein